MLVFSVSVVIEEDGVLVRMLAVLLRAGSPHAAVSGIEEHTAPAVEQYPGKGNQPPAERSLLVRG